MHGWKHVACWEGWILRTRIYYYYYYNIMHIIYYNDNYYVVYVLYMLLLLIIIIIYTIIIYRIPVLLNRMGGTMRQLDVRSLL